MPHLHRHGRCRRASHETGLGPPAGTAIQIPPALTDGICWECISARSSPPTLPGPGSEPVLLQLEAWDNIIRGQVAYQGPVYTGLLPDGRETLTLGTREEQLVELTALAGRLAAQVGKPLLVTLGATVLAFGNSANALRSTQINAKAALEGTRLAQEPLRVAAAAALFSLAGQGMVTWGTYPSQVDTLFDIDILRNPPQQIPEAPADTTWTPATRTLATTALPAGATRLEAWRTGPGSMPEFLHTGARGATEVIIPATITFTPGSLYQLWLVAINSKGKSPAGPVQNWTAV